MSSPFASNIVCIPHRQITKLFSIHMGALIITKIQLSSHIYPILLFRTLSLAFNFNHYEWQCDISHFILSNIWHTATSPLFSFLAIVRCIISKQYFLGTSNDIMATTCNNKEILTYKYVEFIYVDYNVKISENSITNLQQKLKAKEKYYKKRKLYMKFPHKGGFV